MRELCCGHGRLLGVALALSVPNAAAAHALPFGIDLVWPAQARDDRPWVLSNRGIVASGPITAGLLCNEAYGVNTSALPHLWGAASDASLVLATQHGVFHTADQGCTLTPAVGLPSASFGGFAALSDATLLVSTASYDTPGGVYASADRGRTFSLRSANADKEAFTALVAAPSDPMRAYAGGFRFNAETQMLEYVWATSADGARTFVRSSAPASRTPLGVSPRNPDIVFAYDFPSDVTQDTALLKSSDQGRTFTERLRVAGRPVFAADAAGHVWIGASEQPGLMRSDDGGETFTRAFDELTGITCLALHAGALHVCARKYPLELGVWSVSTDGARLTPDILFADVREQVICANDQGVCDARWSDWEAELLDTDGGASDAGPAGDSDAGAAATDAARDASATELRTSASGCCVRYDAPRDTFARSALVLALVAWAHRRRQRVLSEARPR